MKKSILFFIFLLVLGLPTLYAGETIVGTTTRGQGGMIYQDWHSSDGSAANVIMSPGGTTIITTTPSYADQNAQYELQQRETRNAIKSISPGTRTILDDD